MRTRYASFEGAFPYTSRMPIYEYACTACGERTEAKQGFDDPPLDTCQKCGGKLRKLYSPVGIVFKGSGFYATDSKSKSKGASGKASSSSKSESKSGSSSESSSAKSDAKSDSKSDPKSGSKPSNKETSTS